MLSLLIQISIVVLVYSQNLHNSKCRIISVTCYDHCTLILGEFLRAVRGFKYIWDLTIELGNYFVNWFFPGRIQIPPCSDSTKELLKGQTGNIQETIRNL